MLPINIDISKDIKHSDARSSVSEALLYRRREIKLQLVSMPDTFTRRQGRYMRTHACTRSLAHSFTHSLAFSYSPGSIFVRLSVSAMHILSDSVISHYHVLNKSHWHSSCSRLISCIIIRVSLYLGSQ